MAAIHADAFPAAERWTTEAVAALLALPACFGLVHPAGGVLLGRSIADEAEVLTLAVVPAVRRQRIGSSLVNAAAREARDRGARALFLEVSAVNGPALLLYEAIGFAVAGRRRGYYANGTDALVMKLTLGDPAEHGAG